MVYLVPSPALPCLESLSTPAPNSQRGPPFLLHNPFHRPRTWRCDGLQLATFTIFPEHCIYALVIDDLHLLSTPPLFKRLRSSAQRSCPHLLALPTFPCLAFSLSPLPLIRDANWSARPVTYFLKSPQELAVAIAPIANPTEAVTYLPLWDDRQVSIEQYRMGLSSTLRCRIT